MRLSGHSTGMDHKTLLINVERLLLARNASADAISKRARRPDAIRNLRRRVDGDFTGSWTLDTLSDIAAALQVEPWELLRPPGAMSHDADSRAFVQAIVREEMGIEARPARKKAGAKNNR